MKKYYRQEFGPKRGNEIFKEIWTSRQGGQDVRLDYDYLRQFIRNRGGELITTRKNFDNFRIPTRQYIEIKCKEGHHFKVQILHLLYHNHWCPTCNERFCQRIMRLYMESIFRVPFPETSLKDAYGLSVDKGCRLRWDGYSGEVIINGHVFRIAFEYDGEQHDKWPNIFHKTLEQFQTQQDNDRLKNLIAKDDQTQTVLIRLKKVKGFGENSIQLFQREIMRQFYEQTKIRLPFTYALDYDPFTNSLHPRKGTLDKF